MCQQCLNLIEKYYPDLPEEHYATLLMNATAFPFCPPEYLEKQLQELCENTDGTLKGAIKYANETLENEMHQFNLSHKESEKEI